MSMLNRNFARHLMMGVFSHVCSGVLWGMRESVVSDSGRRHWFFFWAGGIGNGKRRLRDPWSSNCNLLYAGPSNTPNFYII